jgi:hypothetical protein
MGKIVMEDLEFTGATEAEYWDEKGSHIATPEMGLVAFTPAMAKIRELEGCWRRPVVPTKKGGDK